MRYNTWLKYPDKSIAIEHKNDQFECIAFNELTQERTQLRICHSPLELKFFLLSINGAPKKEVLSYINELGLKTDN